MALIAIFLFPYLFLGRVLLPLELIPLFPPFAQHAGEFWGRAPEVQNPLLDALQQYYPRRVYFTEALRQGWLPFWNPFVYAGSPFVGAQQAAIYYPPAWVLALFRPDLQFGISAFFHLSLSALGSWLCLRRLGMRSAGAAAGAAAFALNGFMVVWLAYPNVSQWTLCWLPLALYAWEAARDTRCPRALAGAIAVPALAVLGGHGQSSAYVLLAWGGWVALRVLASGGRGAALLRWGLVPGGLALLLSLAQLLPGFDFAPRTDRGKRLPWRQVYEAGMPAAQLWTLLLPRRFGDGTLGSVQQFWMPPGARAGLAYVERSFYPGAAVMVLAVGGLPFALARRRRRVPHEPPEPLPVPEATSTAHDTQERRGSRGAGRRSAPRTSGGARKRTSSPDPEIRETGGCPAATGQPPGLRDLARYAAGLTLLAFLWAAVTPLYYPLWLLIPGFSQFTAVARILCLAGWGLACLAGLGVHGIGEQGETERRHVLVYIGAGAGLAAVCVAAALVVQVGTPPVDVEQALRAMQRTDYGSTQVQEALRALAWVLGPAFAGMLSVLRRPAGDPYLRPAGAAGITAALVAADLFTFGAGFNPAADPQLLQAMPPELQVLQARAGMERVLSVGPPDRWERLNQRLPSNLLSVYGLGDTLGSDSFVTLRYRAWEGALAHSSAGTAWTRPGAPNLRAAGTRYYLTGARTLFPGFQSVSGTAVQEDPRALPYARLHPNVQALENDALLLESLGQEGRFPLVALTAGPDAPTFQGRPAVHPFSARRPNGNRVLLEGDAPEPGLLVVCEQFEPGWKLRVDGQVRQPVPADHLFLGTPLSAGRHRVELVYAPDVVRVGQFGTLAVLAVLAALVALGGAPRRGSGRAGGS